MASFYTNENFPIKVAHYLRQMGLDVLTSHEAGKANQRIPDNGAYLIDPQSLGLY